MPNRSKPNEDVQIEDGRADGIQVYTIEEKKSPSPSPSPTASATATPGVTAPPRAHDPRPTPKPSMRTPAQPTDHRVRVRVPDTVKYVGLGVAIVVLAPIIVAGIVVWGLTGGPAQA